MVQGHAQLWTALVSLAAAVAGMFRFNRGGIRKLRREVEILKMQVEVHRQVLHAHGFRVPPTPKPRE